MGNVLKFFFLPCHGKILSTFPFYKPFSYDVPKDCTNQCGSKFLTKLKLNGPRRRKLMVVPT